MPDDPPRPPPLIDIAIEPKAHWDRARLLEALSRQVELDPGLEIKVDEESQQIILSGQSEAQLEHVVDVLAIGTAVSIGAPQVAYRETITRTVEHDYTHKKRVDGEGQFARIKFRIEPIDAGMGFAFASEVVGGNVPKEYVQGVQKGVASVMGAGPLIGFPIVDVKFVLTDGACHDVDSSVLVFEIAGRAGFKEAVEKASPKILEPIMRVEVLTPEDYVGDVIGDLNSRRARVTGTSNKDRVVEVRATVPLANMFGYVNSLRALTHGLGRYTMSFSHYERVPDPPFAPDDVFPPAAAMRA